MKTYVADFETTTLEENCHVWAYAICEVGNSENVTIGNTIDDFMKWCEEQDDNPKVLFHNLKFDCQFIIDWLFRKGYKHVDDKKRASRTFTTLISDKGMFYAVEVIFSLKGRKVKKVTFQDSLKLIPLSVDGIAKAFKLPIQKLKIDYTAHDHLPEGSPLTEEEAEYIRHDVQIVAHAVDFFYSQGLTQMTIGSCALNEYKNLIEKKNFNRYFPTPKYHKDVKQSYRGGFTYLNPEFAGKVVGNGVVLDVNSLYPSVMRGVDNEYLPFGTPIFFQGKYEKDEVYPLYTQMFRCQFELRPGKIPTIQIKNSLFFKGNEYLTSSNDEEVVLCLNSVDMELFLEQYDVYNIEFLSGWKFKATKGLFDDYIDKWSANKIQAKKDGNHGLYLISKLFLNSLYGKFGTDTTIKSKVPYMGDDGKIHYHDTEPEEKKGIYVALASFITSYARRKTITSAQRIMDDYASGKSNIQFVYADTDSLHCISPDFELP
jgi:DNA polymerase elongation subunit (family B)